MAREMTPQARAEQLYGSLTCTTYRDGYQDPDNDIALIADVLQQTRRAALLEAAKVCSEWYKIDRTYIHTVAEMAEVLATTLDRLASEGG